MIYSDSFSGSTFEPATLVELLRWRAMHQPNRLAYTFLVDGDTEEVTLTYEELDRQARAIGALLQQCSAQGERALLLYPPGLEFIAVFFGCLYGGVIAVPAYPPHAARLNRTLPRFRAIANDAQPLVVLTTSAILCMVEALLAQFPDLQSMRWLATDNVASDLTEHWRDPAVSSNTLAFLQYTSGSTASPKGVMVSHGNLLHNSALIHRWIGQTPNSRGVIWLPPYHDLGLITGILQPLYDGFHVTHMSPLAFLQRPLRWLQTISRTRATISGAPNFAFDLCVRKISPEQRATLDLSSWDVAYIGAEPIRDDTLNQFAAAFEPCGFRPEAFLPGYGLAETTLMVSGGKKAALPVVRAFQRTALKRNQVVEVSVEDESARRLVSCGQALLDLEIVIVDPETCTRCPPNRVGEIWVSGPSVAQGYKNRPEETEQTFRAYLADTGEGPFLRTGDLGFLKDGELFVTGRLKDLIIIAGRNHHPQDIEWTVEQSHPAVRPGCCAAFSVEIGGRERLVVVAEVDRRYKPEHRPPTGGEKEELEGRQSPNGHQEDAKQNGDPDARLPLDVDAVVQAIRRAVIEQHEVQFHAVVLLKAGSIPKTSNGKIQRHACRAGFLAGSLDVVRV